MISIETGAFGSCSLTDATFENAEGWKVAIGSKMIDAQDVTVSDRQTAAEYLKDTYADYYWKRF